MTQNEIAKNLLLRDKHIDYHYNKKISRIFYTSKGKFDGVSKSYYNSGIISHRIVYKNGLLDGEFKMWDRKGNLVQYFLYKDNKIIEDYLDD